MDLTGGRQLPGPSYVPNFNKLDEILLMIDLGSFPYLARLYCFYHPSRETKYCVDVSFQSIAVRIGKGDSLELGTSIICLGSWVLWSVGPPGLS